ncbi:MAG: flavodoxin [Hydrogenophaga sp.]|uniref:flavodoxin family protein n=1 Tax=Hydrogenophaga sp. TaxID=1904254 RepID=UPI00262F943C|nr:flavodoxin [Hydrogenophaga sp.]MDM7944104.1 flavodoxin [Hydrogenophaga sp.]
MSRILVVYHSRSGHTEFVARQIAARCHADLEHIQDSRNLEGVPGYLRCALEAILGWRPPIERARHRPGDYDLVIVGTPVWFWSVASPVRTWVQRHHAALNNVALFCTCGGSGHAKVLDDLERLCGHPALARLALTERAVPQCQRDPALRRFLLELKRVPAVSVSLPPMQDQAPA